MSEEELDTIRQRKMQQLMQMQAQAEQEGAALQEFEEKKQAILRQILTPEARERLNSIRMAKPDFADMVEAQLLLLLQNGRIKSVIDEELLKNILGQLTPKKKEFKIRRV